MKTVISTIIPKKAKTTNTANVNHKCILPYKKVGWPEGHKTLKANHKSKEGEANFEELFHVIDGTEDAKCCAIWLKDFTEQILQPAWRKKSWKVKGVKVNQFNHINDILQKLTAGTVQVAVRAALFKLSRYNTGTIKADNITMFKTEQCKANMMSFKTDQEIKDYWSTDNYWVLTYTKILHHIKMVMLIRSNPTASYMELRFVIQTMKANPTVGIMKYC